MGEKEIYSWKENRNKKTNVLGIVIGPLQTADPHSNIMKLILFPIITYYLQVRKWKLKKLRRQVWSHS